MAFDEISVNVQVVASSAVDGYLKIGDVIRQIDHVDANRLSHDYAMNLIVNAGSSISLVIFR